MEILCKVTKLYYKNNFHRFHQSCFYVVTFRFTFRVYSNLKENDYIKDGSTFSLSCTVGKAFRDENRNVHHTQRRCILQIHIPCQNGISLISDFRV